MTRDKRRSIFLDRDGVINKALIKDGKPFSPPSPESVSIPEGVPTALRKLKEAGFLLIVITNQPDVARGKQTKDVVEQIHSMLRSQLPLDEIMVCYHDDEDHCGCRKPQPGMILQASRKYSIDLPSSFVIGDRWKDVEAGKRAGCKTIFVDSRYLEEKPTADLAVNSLEEAVPWILNW
ncbi:HAD family hydrolase [bacterium]|nr:HAD family hydrolase [bacterium]MCI0602250.1 HAD family hydrolase [bacterium]